jgi:uncharacterized protein (DUF1501 family)
MLFAASPEFHTTNMPAIKTSTRVARRPIESQNRTYKATVVVFLHGGCDSFNVLVPHSGCGAKDMYDEYAAVRTVAKLTKNQILQVSVPAGTQPCTKFGVHPDLSVLRTMYNDGDLAFIANIGTLIEPLSKSDFEAKTKQVPPSLFAHNTQQRQGQSVHAQLMGAKGVLGRIRDALSAQHAARLPFAARSYSVNGAMKMVEGQTAANILNKNNGMQQYVLDNSVRGRKLQPAIRNISANEMASIFGETFSALVEDTLNKADLYGHLLDGASLSTQFGEESLDKQLQQVAKTISIRSQIKSERDVFVVQLGGFDTHSDLGDQLSLLFGQLNAALTSFVAEMKAKNVWNNVTIATVSDFGRTLTSNGVGTDHAWGGIMAVAGGAVRGGQVHGQYLTDLTSQGPRVISRGRVIPTLPWEAMWYGIAQWMGVEPSQMAEVLPNAGNFVPGVTLLNPTQLFDTS